MKHRFAYADRRVLSIALVGAGGTGSQVFRALAKMATILPKVDGPQLQVSVYDDDIVTDANIGRQEFYPADVGANKAETLVHRANMFLGLSFEAVPRRFEVRTIGHQAPDIIIGCVDSASSRRGIQEMHRSGYDRRPPYWLDCGNREHTGQVILGQLVSPQSDFYMRLPTVMELFPQLMDKSIPEDDSPSCSVAEAIAKQDLFTNGAIAQAAGEMLWALIRHQQISYCGRFIDSRNGASSRLAIDRDVWKRFGHKGKRKPPKRKAASTSRSQLIAAR